MLSLEMVKRKGFKVKEELSYLQKIRRSQQHLYQEKRVVRLMRFIKVPCKKRSQTASQVNIGLSTRERSMDLYGLSGLLADRQGGRSSEVNPGNPRGFVRQGSFIYGKLFTLLPG